MLIGRSLGDRELRHICSSPSCGFVDYSNPKMVVGCIVEHQGKILLCRCARTNTQRVIGAGVRGKGVRGALR